MEVKAGASVNPPRLTEESSSRIRKYAEDLKRYPNADVGPKDIFAIAFHHQVVYAQTACNLPNSA